MRVTNISDDNIDYFRELAPEEDFENENLIWLGVVDSDGTACGVIGAGVFEELAYIDWIYVDPAYRKKGAGRALLKWMKTVLWEAQVKAVEISFSDEAEDLEEFLMEEGFFIETDEEIYSVPLKELIFSDVIDTSLKTRRMENPVVTLSEMKDPGELYDYLSDNGIPFSMKADRLEHSLVLLNENGRICGCMLISEGGNGDLEISYLLTRGLKRGAIDLFFKFRDMVVENGREENSIIFTDRSGEVSSIIEMLTRTDIGEYVVSGRKTGLITLF